MFSFPMISPTLASSALQTSASLAQHPCCAPNLHSELPAWHLTSGTPHWSMTMQDSSHLPTRSHSSLLCAPGGWPKRMTLSELWLPGVRGQWGALARNQKDRGEEGQDTSPRLLWTGCLFLLQVFCSTQFCPGL